MQGWRTQSQNLALRKHPVRGRKFPFVPFIEPLIGGQSGRSLFPIRKEHPENLWLITMTHGVGSVAEKG